MAVPLFKIVNRAALGMMLFTAAALAQPTHVAPAEFREWPQITEAEKQLRAPVVEKDAGAEILVWRVYVLDEFLSRNTLQRVYYNYVRLKVFDEKGKQQPAGKLAAATGESQRFFHISEAEHGNRS